VFSLETVDDDGILDVRPSQLGIPAECKQPATALKFGETGRLVCATNNGQINVLQVSHEDVRLKHVFREHVEDWSASSHHFPVICLDLSSDGKWLAAGRFSAGKGAVHVFTLPTNEEGRYQHWWSVPKMDATTTCVKFLGGGGIESSLAVGCSSNEFYIYNLGRRSLSHWSNDMGLPPLKSLPKELTSRSEPVARIVANPAGPQKLILGSHGYFCAVDLDQPVPERARMVPENHLRAQRLELAKEDDANVHSRPPRKKSKNNGINNFTVCLQYCEIQFQDFIAEDEMVVVEQPWMSILEELPDALERRAYGT
jgi:U3 small nucleolar RNA-associated protein 4